MRGNSDRERIAGTDFRDSKVKDHSVAAQTLPCSATGQIGALPNGELIMSSVKDVLLMRFVPERAQCGLGALRLCTGLNFILHHGWEKRPANWAQFMAHFADPIGVGSYRSFLIAFFPISFAEFCCPLDWERGGLLSTDFAISSSPGPSCITLPYSAKGRDRNTVN
jgi:hypothetical protein